MTGTSYNGWPCSPDKNEINVQPFGDVYGLPFPGGVRGGDVATVLAYVVTQLHFRVEACISGFCWGYEYRENVNNPGSMSCHASATAVDFNAPLHPNSASGTFTDSQVGTIYSILNEVQGAVQWGGDYTGTKDEMHFEIIVDADYLAWVAASLDSGIPAPTPEPEPMEDYGVMQLLTIAGGDGKIYAANVAGRRFYYVGNPDSLGANQLAGTYSPDIVSVDEGQMNHVRYACQIQPDDDPSTPIP